MDNNLIMDSPKEENRYDLMESIANSTVPSQTVADLVEKDKTVNQMKLFVLSEAKRELSRVIKLMKFLDKVEDAYQNKVDESLDKMSLYDYQQVISSITACINRSNTIINSVMKDNELMNILIYNENNINNSTTNIIGSNNNLGLENPESRDRVTKAVANILSKITDIENGKISLNQPSTTVEDSIPEDNFVDPLEEGMKNNE